MKIAVAAPDLAVVAAPVEQRALIAQRLRRSCAQCVNGLPIERRTAGRKIRVIVGDDGGDTLAATEAGRRGRVAVESSDDIAELDHQTRCHAAALGETIEQRVVVE